MSREIYLDNNATTRPLPEVIDAMVVALDAGFGNASSAHSVGERARLQLRQARESVAALIGASDTQIIFTSGGTEANNVVLASVVQRPNACRRIVTSQVEHSSVLHMGKYLESMGCEVVYLPVDRYGLISLDDLDEAIRPQTDLVSIQWVNNETGTIQPIESIGLLCRARNVRFHTDAAQAVGKLPVAVESLPIDFLTFTAHKLHGPSGVGAICAKDPQLIRSQLHGGPQENGRRSGSENLPGIVGFGVAASIRHSQQDVTIATYGYLRNRFERRILDSIPGVEVNGSAEHRVCNTTNLMFPHVDGQALVARLDQVGVQCSQSSACTNHRPEPSYVLRAMGLSEDAAYSSVRFSVAAGTTSKALDYAAQEIERICSQLREFELNLVPSGVYQKQVG
ncbi:MAG: cysteine desulfurase [Ardenticatenia bacterium]|nr:cysteine desulfurase [Ardenticatenia bacterium]